ncbi:Uncharacterised protein [Mycobacteroides abscessus subsp. abscessus]|nr:Uncharacterised protein [Mycobacteroides abscessus subsp. abscessus]
MHAVHLDESVADLFQHGVVLRNRLRDTFVGEAGAGCGHEPGDRGHINDPPVPAGAHSWQHRTHHGQHREKVQLEHPPY